jgi:hypothetical protein
VDAQDAHRVSACQWCKGGTRITFVRTRARAHAHGGVPPNETIWRRTSPASPAFCITDTPAQCPVSDRRCTTAILGFCMYSHVKLTQIKAASLAASKDDKAEKAPLIALRQQQA